MATLPSSFLSRLHAARGDITVSGTRLDLLRLLSRTLDRNVLKLFRVVADPTRNRIYVAGILTSHIAVLDGDSHDIIRTIDSGIFENSYKYLALDPAANRLYIRDGLNNRLSAIDLDTDTVIGPVPLPDGSIGDVAADPARGLVYITTTTAPGFRAFDGRTLESVFTISDMGAALPSIVLDAEEDMLYLLNGTAGVGEVFKMKLSDRTITTLSFPVSAVAGPGLLAYSRADRRFFVAAAGGITVLSSDGRTERTLSLPSYDLQDMTFNERDGRLLALFIERPGIDEIAGTGGRLWSWDGRSWAEMTTFGNKPHSLAVNAATGRFYCPAGDDSKVWFGLARGRSMTALRIGDSVEQLVPSAGGPVYIASRLGGSHVVAYDPETRTATSFTAGTWPMCIAVGSASHELLVLNAWDSTISCFELPSRRLVRTVAIGLPAGTTDRLPDFAVDFARGRAYAAYPEFGKIAVVDWRSAKAFDPLTITDFVGGDIGGGPNQMQVALSETAGRLLVFSPALRRLDTYDLSGATPSRISRIETSSRVSDDGDRLAWKILFIDAARDRAFVGGQVHDVRTGSAIGSPLARGLRVFGSDDSRDAYWAASVDDGLISVHTFDRTSLARLDSMTLGAADYLGPDFALDTERDRLYMTHLAAAQFDEYELA